MIGAEPTAGASLLTYDVLISAGHEGRPASCAHFPQHHCNLGRGGERAWTPIVADAATQILRQHGVDGCATSGRFRRKLSGRARGLHSLRRLGSAVRQPRVDRLRAQARCGGSSSVARAVRRVLAVRISTDNFHGGFARVLRLPAGRCARREASCSSWVRSRVRRSTRGSRRACAGKERCSAYFLSELDR